MDMSHAAFFALAVPLVAAALGVVLNRHPVRSALSLVATLFLLAVVFVFLNAHLVAALQIIVYAGAIMVLFLFVIMLLNLQQDPAELRWRGRQRVAVVASALFALGVIGALRRGGGPAPGPGMAEPLLSGFGSTAELSTKLFTHYLLPFEITGALLLVAVIGAVVVAKKRID
jgi:NADH-quinone oxidoreductase subunit J